MDSGQFTQGRNVGRHGVANVPVSNDVLAVPELVQAIKLRWLTFGRSHEIQTRGNPFNARIATALTTDPRNANNPTSAAVAAVIPITGLYELKFPPPAAPWPRANIT